MILVMEYCEGVQINDAESLSKLGVDVYDVSRKIGERRTLFSLLLTLGMQVRCILR